MRQIYMIIKFIKLMNIKTTLTFAIVAVLASCATKKNDLSEADCPPKACTMEFRSVGVIFKDTTGDTLQVKDFSVRLKSNNKKLPNAASENAVPQNPYYLVASDADKSALSEAGDTLIIAAKHPSSGIEKTSEMVISGGRCECHINKKSGDETIVFD